MDLKIVTDVSAELLTHGNVSDFLKYDDNDSNENTLIDNMCKAVRSHFERITGRSFIEKTYQVQFRYGDSPYILPVVPVISVDSIKTVDVEGNETTLTLNSDYWKRGKYEVEIITQSMSTITNPFVSFDSKYDLLVNFKAGYGNSDTETLPEDLKHAMKMQLKQWYDNRDDFYEFNILGSVKAILNRYKVNLI